MTTIRARIAPDHAEMADVGGVTVFGLALTRDFDEVEVDYDVFAKLKTNPTIDVLVRKPRGEKVAETGAAEGDDAEGQSADEQPEG